MNREDSYWHRAATQAFVDSGWCVALISSVRRQNSLVTSPYLRKQLQARSLPVRSWLAIAYLGYYSMVVLNQ
jgi:hypothetical protein